MGIASILTIHFCEGLKDPSKHIIRGDEKSSVQLECEAIKREADMARRETSNGK